MKMTQGSVFDVDVLRTGQAIAGVDYKEQTFVCICCCCCSLCCDRLSISELSDTHCQCQLSVISLVS